MSEEENDMTHDDEEDFGLDSLESVLIDLRAVVVRPAEPEVAAAHIARMQETALSTVAASAPAPVVTEASRAAESFWTFPRKVAAAGAAVFVALFGLGGLGMAGALPGPIQDFVATVTDPLGFDMPRSDDPSPSQGKKGSDPSATVPGQGAGATLAPGQTGSTPGQAGATPANGGEAPGQSGSTPGQSGNNPSVTAPGQSGNPSVTAPGQSGNPSVTAPGQSGRPSATAPGQAGSAPGQSGSAGSNGNAGGSSATAPGHG